MATNRLALAHAIAFLLPLVLLAGAWGSQLFGGLIPCELCHMQRWPHYAAVVIAALAYVVPQRRARVAMIALAALAILISGGMGVFHAGIEYRWWPNPLACSNTLGSGSLADILKAPIISCDNPQWSLFGISLAGFNALISIAGGSFVLALLAWKAPR